jgi:hypothetical protein
MTAQTMDLLNYIRDLANHMALGTALPWDQVNESLETIQEHLEGMIKEYQQPAPDGAEVVQQFMLEAMELFLEAVDGLYEFLESKDRDRLSESVIKAEEANDILGCVEYALEQNKQYLNQFSAH